MSIYADNYVVDYTTGEAKLIKHLNKIRVDRGSYNNSRTSWNKSGKKVRIKKRYNTWNKSSRRRIEHFYGVDFDSIKLWKHGRMVE